MPYIYKKKKIFFRQKNGMNVQLSDIVSGVEVGNEQELKWCAYLLEVDLKSFHQLLTQKRVVS